MSTSIRVKEDEKNFYFKYMLNGEEWVLIYNKEKDNCLLLKRARPAQLNSLSHKEKQIYKEVLDYAISYHHEKGDAETH